MQQRKIVTVAILTAFVLLPLPAIFVRGNPSPSNATLSLGIIYHYGRNGTWIQDSLNILVDVLDMWKIPWSLITNNSATKFNWTQQDLAGYNVVILPVWSSLIYNFFYSDVDLLVSSVHAGNFSLITFNLSPSAAGENDGYNDINEDIYNITISSTICTLGSQFDVLREPPDGVGVIANVTVGYVAKGFPTAYGSTAVVSNVSWRGKFPGLLHWVSVNKRETAYRQDCLLLAFIYAFPYKVFPMLTLPHCIGRMDDIQTSNETRKQRLLNFLAQYPYVQWSHGICGYHALKYGIQYNDFGKYYGDVVSHGWKHHHIFDDNMGYTQQYGNYSLEKEYLTSNFMEYEYTLDHICPFNKFNGTTIQVLDELGFTAISGGKSNKVGKDFYELCGVPAGRMKMQWCHWRLSYTNISTYHLYNMPYTWMLSWNRTVSPLSGEDDLRYDPSRYLRTGLGFVFASHGAGEAYPHPDEWESAMSQILGWLWAEYPFIQYLTMRDHAINMYRLDETPAASWIFSSTGVSVTFSQPTSKTINHLVLLLHTATEKKIKTATLDSTSVWGFGVDSPDTNYEETTYLSYVILPPTTGGTLSITWGTPSVPHVTQTSGTYIKNTSCSNNILSFDLAVREGQKYITTRSVVDCVRLGQPTSVWVNDVLNTTWSYNASTKLLTLTLNHKITNLKVEINWVPAGVFVVESCNSTGARVDIYELDETVFVNGNGYFPSTTYDFYLMEDVSVWTDGMVIPSRVPGTATAITSDPSGNIPPTAVWDAPLTVGIYDIVIDVNGNGQYDAEIDALDDNDIEVTAGFLVIPEFPSSLILPLFMVATLLVVTVHRRKHIM